MKSDIHSLGVVMLELLTGRMPFDSYVLLYFTLLYLKLHLFVGNIDFWMFLSKRVDWFRF